MSLAQVQEVTKLVHSKLVKRKEDLCPNAWRPFSDLKGWCAIASAMVCAELLVRGINAKMVEGFNDMEGHCWVELKDGTVADPTAGQFRAFKDKFPNYWYVGPKTDIHSKAEWDEVQELQKPQLKEWPVSQRPNEANGKKFLSSEQLEVLGF